MDRASIIGILLGIGAVAGGNMLEGGKVGSLLQPAAAIIVFGGTAGATLLSFPIGDVVRAAAALRSIFFGKPPDAQTLIREIVRCAEQVRRKGFISLEPDLVKIEPAFLRQALALAVDGMNPKTLRETLEHDLYTYEEEQKRVARVVETAGGFAPTIGIIGAVLGLIHVMENLADPARLGSGIAVAFVATVYGVGSANLFLLPAAKKLMIQLRQEVARRELIMEGVLGMLAGLNPHYLEMRLRACVK